MEFLAGFAFACFCIIALALISVYWSDEHKHDALLKARAKAYKVVLDPKFDWSPYRKGK